MVADDIEYCSITSGTHSRCALKVLLLLRPVRALFVVVLAAILHLFSGICKTQEPSRRRQPFLMIETTQFLGVLVKTLKPSTVGNSAKRG
jgi:hypothetical protein